MSTIGSYIRYCHKRGFTPVLACHDPRDIPIAKRFEKRAEIFFSEETSDFYELYDSSALVLGFRLHAAIISLSLGVPFIPVYFDHRGLGFIKTYGAEDENLSITKLNLRWTLTRKTDRILGGNLDDLAMFAQKKEALSKTMATFVERSIGQIIDVPLTVSSIENG